MGELAGLRGEVCEPVLVGRLSAIGGSGEAQHDRRARSARLVGPAGLGCRAARRHAERDGECCDRKPDAGVASHEFGTVCPRAGGHIGTSHESLPFDWCLQQCAGPAFPRSLKGEQRPPRLR